MIISYLHYLSSLAEANIIQVNVLGLDEFIRDYNEVINSENRYISVEYFLILYPKYLPNIKSLLKILLTQCKDGILVIMFDNPIFKQIQINSLVGSFNKKLNTFKFTAYCYVHEGQKLASTITLKI